MAWSGAVKPLWRHGQIKHLLRFLAFAAVVATCSCDMYGGRFMKLQPPERQGTTITERSYIRVMADEIWRFKGYVEKHEKVVGSKLVRYTLIFDKNYEKVGYVDEFGRTYKLINGTKQHVGDGTIDMSCKMVFDLGINDIITFELMNLSKLEHVEEE